MPAPHQSISVYQLAGRLGLRVVRSSGTMAVLGNRHNRVLLFPGRRGRAYVNNRRLGVRGVLSVRDLLFVPRSLPRHLAPLLRRPAPPTPGRRPRRRSAPSASPLGRVVVDAGHGGRDPGARSVLDYDETEVVLPVARELGRLLRINGARVTLTRAADEFLELNERADIANRLDADLLVSVHADWAERSSARGFTVYIARGASQTSRRAAEAIADRLQAAGVHSRGVKEANFRVLVRTEGPAVLVELGFLSNYGEARRLRSPSYRHRLAEAIAAGVADVLR
ncbi:MAG: N-acetylmuramoyl-L-alanine amidase [Planctomycetota bacterium]